LVVWHTNRILRGCGNTGEILFAVAMHLTRLAADPNQHTREAPRNHSRMGEFSFPLKIGSCAIRPAATTIGPNLPTEPRNNHLSLSSLRTVPLSMSRASQDRLPTSSSFTHLHRTFDQSSSTSGALPCAPVIQAHGASVVDMMQAAAKSPSPTTARRRGISQDGGESFPSSNST
jgi:hypothetical protein